MVIKDNKLREKLWNLHFVDGLRKKECVARFTGAASGPTCSFKLHT